MSAQSTRRSVLTLVGAITLGLISAAASGHVTLDSPDGGEELDVGSVFQITWHVAIQHNTQNWDLSYSTNSASGPWTDIAVDLPAGDISAGAVHTFDWTVPDVVDDTIWVRVVQDNSNTDYLDVSDGAFSIVDVCLWDVDGDSGVGAADLLELLASWGQAGVPSDFDGGGVGVTDLLELLANWGACA